MEKPRDDVYERFVHTQPCLFDPEYEVVGLTWHQKFALKRIIWKAWLKRVLGIDRD